MKKTILIISILLAASVAYIHSIENTLQLSFKTGIPITASQRRIVDIHQWKNWWPGHPLSDSTFTFQERTIIVRHLLTSSVELIDTRLNTTSVLSFIPLSNTESQFSLNANYPLSLNFFKRITQLFDFYAWKKEQKNFVRHLYNYFSSVQNIYGFNIEMKKVLNSPHISTNASFDQKPDWNQVYDLTDQIRAYVHSINHQVLDSPILNMYVEEGKHKVMVAYSTDTVLPSFGPFQLKQMVKGGNMLMAEVKGGPHTIEQCLNQMVLFVQDYGKSSPAIPYQRLITDRRKITDTTQWITIVNYPVFE